MRLIPALILFLTSTLYFNPVLSAPVNINTADVATIASSLKGIGLKKAANIVAYRTKHGPFKSPDDLDNVKGIGKKTIEKNRHDIQTEKVKAQAITVRKDQQKP